MHTQDELRAGMNALATATEPLSAMTVLRQAKRHRSRRRLLVAASTAAAVVAVTGGATIAAPHVLDRNATTTDTPRPGVTSSAPAPAPSMARERRFAFGTEERTERGVFTTAIADRLTPDLAPESDMTVQRAPGQDTVPAKDDPFAGDTVRYLTVAGTRVQVDEYAVDGGTARQLSWSWGGAGYVLRADRGTTDEGVAFGTDDADLIWIIEQLMARNPK